MKTKKWIVQERLLDASALIAWYSQEKGWEIVEQQLQTATAISSSNLIEVIGKLVSSGQAPVNEVEQDIKILGLRIVPLLEVMVQPAAFFYARRHPYQLSLGDCVCLATAETQHLEVLTAEQNWAKVPNLRCKVHLIR